MSSQVTQSVSIYFRSLHSGKRIVCNDNDAAETVYNILENRLWDDPNKVSL